MWYYSVIGRLPWGSNLGPDAVALNEAVRAVVDPNDGDTTDDPEDDADAVAVVLGLLVRGSLYLVPGCPGLVGSSRTFGFFASIKTTRPMSGLDFGSDCTHSNPNCIHVAICSVAFDEDAIVGSTISKLCRFL